MNAVEIEEAISALAERRPFDAEEFPYGFLEAFGNKETVGKRRWYATIFSFDRPRSRSISTERRGGSLSQAGFTPRSSSPWPLPCRPLRWSSPAPPPCSSRPFLHMFHPSVVLFMTTRIAFVAHFSGLTGMRRLAFNFFRAAPTAGDAVVNRFRWRRPPSSGEGEAPLAGGADTAWTCWRPVFSSLFNSSPAAPTRVSAGGRAGLRGPRDNCRTR